MYEDFYDFLKKSILYISCIIGFFLSYLIIEEDPVNGVDLIIAMASFPLLILLFQLKKWRAVIVSTLIFMLSYLIIGYFASY